VLIDDFRVELSHDYFKLSMDCLDMTVSDVAGQCEVLESNNTTTTKINVIMTYIGHIRGCRSRLKLRVYS